MGNLFLDPQLHWVARILIARNEPSKIDRDIRHLHDRYMLVPDYQFGAFSHDLREVYDFERGRQLNTKSLRVIASAKLKIDAELGRIWDDAPDGLPV